MDTSLPTPFRGPVACLFRGGAGRASLPWPCLLGVAGPVPLPDPHRGTGLGKCPSHTPGLLCRTAAPAPLLLQLQCCRQSSVVSGDLTSRQAPSPAPTTFLLTQHPASYRDARGAGARAGSACAVSRSQAQCPPEALLRGSCGWGPHSCQQPVDQGSALQEGGTWEGQAFRQRFSPMGSGAPHGQHSWPTAQRADHFQKSTFQKSSQQG